MSKPRPRCVHCGKPYGTRHAPSEVVVHPANEPEPRYTGNGIVLTSRKWNTGTGKGSIMGVSFGPDSVVIYRDVWDGETWTAKAPPFCTKNCALDYARKAYKLVGSFK